MHKFFRNFVTAFIGFDELSLTWSLVFSISSISRAFVSWNCIVITTRHKFTRKNEPTWNNNTAECFLKTASHIANLYLPYGLAYYLIVKGAHTGVSIFSTRFALQLRTELRLIRNDILLAKNMGRHVNSIKRLCLRMTAQKRSFSCAIFFFSHRPYS